MGIVTLNNSKYRLNIKFCFQHLANPSGSVKNSISPETTRRLGSDPLLISRRTESNQPTQNPPHIRKKIWQIK